MAPRTALSRRGLLGIFGAAGLLLATASIAWACTTYKGTLTLCGNSAITVGCVTSTGSNQPDMTYTTSGVTAARDHVSVSGSGLPGDTYYALFLDPALAPRPPLPADVAGVTGVLSSIPGIHCMWDGAIIGQFTVSGPSASFNLGSIDISGATPGHAAVCLLDKKTRDTHADEGINTGNEAPLEIVVL